MNENNKEQKPETYHGETRGDSGEDNADDVYGKHRVASQGKM